MSLRWILLLIIGMSWTAGQANVDELPIGRGVERHLPPDVDLSQWTKDAGRVALDAGDRVETFEVLVPEPETVKLHDLVPPVYFESGVANVPESTVSELRSVLEQMRDRANVRLNLVGHADNQPLSSALVERYGDNDGLSRERAGEVAEFFQMVLGLPPEAVSYEWAGDSEPVASNSTESGRALNRRVDVEVWYDELTDVVAERELVVSEDVRTAKVCRVETVCKLRYVEGHAKRARVQNLVPPLYYQAADLTVSPEFVGEIEQTLANLRDRQNVVIKLIGHTDDAPLSEREARIYGDRLSLSRARAHRVALALKEQLDLPAKTVLSDGYGDDRLAASNGTARGRALNRRIEVEFWYDDSLQELPDEPQLCPADAAAETVTRVYDPAWGGLPTISLTQGQPVLGSGALAKLARGLSDVSDRANARLRFIGYTRNEGLDRRTAQIYGDDVGLSTARARRTMEKVAAELGLESKQAEHVGRGYIHSQDVINAGFVQGEESYVEVQVVYDELAILDDYEGVDVDPLTRELTPENPFALNMMRITVDGEPIDDPQRSSADVQRCTDVAMEEKDIRFRFDTSTAHPRLDVAASAHTVKIHTIDPATAVASPVRFRMYANYAAFIERAEVRIFDAGTSIQSDALAVLPVGEEGYAEWEPDVHDFDGSVDELVYVLRAYGSDDGYFDETQPKTLWVAHAGELAEALLADESGSDLETEHSLAEPVLSAGYGANSLAFQNIPLGTGTVMVEGSGLDASQDIWVAGSRVPVDASGSFVSEVLLPDGGHTVEVAMLDEEGAGELYLRDLSLEKNDWFYAGMADFTWSENSSSENADLFVGENASQDFDSSVDGRIALYASGKFGAGWGLTTRVDTREDELGNLFSNILDKDPSSLFRRMDPDHHYPTFGDDSTVTELAPSQGGLYLKLDKDDSYGLWGNYKVGYMNNELAQVDRGLYGVQGHYESTGVTSFGEKRLVADLFGAEPGTIPSRQDFLGTGGSFYYLRHQDILMGSERVRIELRDKASGIVTGVVNLMPSADYDIDYLQGTVLLAEPLSATVNDNLLVRTGGSSGDEAYLVVRYEYTPGFDELDALAAGGQAHAWLNDRIKIGMMANENSNDDAQFDSSLQAADMTVRLNANTWLKVQAGRSEGQMAQSLISDDGGFGFQSLGDGALAAGQADAYRGDLSIGLESLSERLDGRLTLYGQTLESGYSAPGLEALTDTEAYGGSLSLELTRSLSMRGKSDVLSRDDSLSTQIHEVNLNYQFNPRWKLSGGIRHDDRQDDSPIALPLQAVGQRTDAVMQLGYDGRGEWGVYGFVQDSISASSTRSDNGRVGMGGTYLVSDRIQMEMEVSDGDSGPGGRIGTSYRQSERTSYYVNYALENERTDNGQRGSSGSEGNLMGGMKTRLSDTTSVFVEERYQHGRQMSGLTHATGVQLVPTERWNLSVSSDIGTLKDRQTGAETDRVAGGMNVGFGTEALQLSVGVEYRDDKTELAEALATKRKTWLYRNSARWQMNPASRLLGKFNYSTSDSSEGAFYDGEFTEAVVGYGFRPVRHDRLNALAKYTFFYNVPTAGQVTQSNALAEYVQKSHVASVDLTYDLSPRLSVGAKYAYRLGEISLDRDDLAFFDNSASLYVLRADWRFRGQWEVMVEGRALEFEDFGETRSGALLALSRYFGDHFKVGAGYNFTDFSDDLTDLDYDHRGLFLNLTGAF